MRYKPAVFRCCVVGSNELKECTCIRTRTFRAFVWSEFEKEEPNKKTISLQLISVCLCGCGTNLVMRRYVTWL